MVAGRNVLFPEVCKIRKQVGARYKTSIICNLSCHDFYNTRNQTLGEPWLRFVGNVASARHFQLLSEEDVDVKLPDCAMFSSTGPKRFDIFLIYSINRLRLKAQHGGPLAACAVPQSQIDCFLSEALASIWDSFKKNFSPCSVSHQLFRTLTGDSITRCQIAKSFVTPVWAAFFGPYGQPSKQYIPKPLLPQG